MDNTNEQLLKRRSVLKGCLTRLDNSLTPEFLQTASAQMLKLKEERAQEIFHEYMELLSQIEDDDDDDPTKMEDRYFHCMDVLRVKQQQLSTLLKSDSSNRGISAPVKLPNINIPDFNDFIMYLEARALAFENSDNGRATTSGCPPPSRSQGEFKVANVASKEEKQCLFCIVAAPA
ncbi:uncharacterized protein LOC126380935 isoform X2 [Pectinophora gossypiella]|uniref:uncharacterized protein LOC126380935 isoform X2 n=1 Tax=Pectinophora gossypiella TaxID=13191 RepID=UPI00214EF5E0|nr:uncharacterized protein LOC126380935 isoform X2 [Pectinophora gossypiella]